VQPNERSTFSPGGPQGRTANSTSRAVEIEAQVLAIGGGTPTLTPRQRRSASPQVLRAPCFSRLNPPRREALDEIRISVPARLVHGAHWSWRTPLESRLLDDLVASWDALIELI